MIISQPRQPFDFSTRKIAIPAWAAAPLSLNRNGRFWGIYGQPPQHNDQRTFELILTTIHPQFWNDLWRLEFTTDDRIGNLTKIADLFRCERIEVIASEGSIHSVSKYHSMTFILSLRNYSSPVDGDTELRARADQFSAKYLQFLILSNFADQILFNDAGFPQFKLKRMNQYRRMSNVDLLVTYRKLCGDDGLMLSATQEVETPEAFGRELEKLGGEVFYTSAVDTKDRVIRTLLFSRNDRVPGHIQLSTYNFDSHVLYSVLKLISDRQGNIIRYQVRPGLNEDGKGMLSRLAKGKAKDPAEQRPARIDLTVEPRHPDQGTRQLLASLLDAVRTDKILARAFVDVTRLSPPLKKEGRNR
jgi:hypothetical protein